MQPLWINLGAVVQLSRTPQARIILNQSLILLYKDMSMPEVVTRCVKGYWEEEEVMVNKEWLLIFYQKECLPEP